MENVHLWNTPEIPETAGSPAGVEELMKVSVKGKEFIVVCEHTTNSNADARVDGDKIRIRIPLSLSREEGFRVFLELKAKIMRKLERAPVLPRKRTKMAFRDGQSITVLGKTFVLKKEDGKAERTSCACFHDGLVLVRLCRGLSAEHEEEIFSNLVRRVIAREVFESVSSRVSQLNDVHIQGCISRIFIKDNLTKWGSCSSGGNINLSFRILFAPQAVMDYVFIHELAHLKEQNHSPAFWAIVENAMPDYKNHFEWLKNNGHTLGMGDENERAANGETEDRS